MNTIFSQWDQLMPTYSFRIPKDCGRAHESSATAGTRDRRATAVSSPEKKKSERRHLGLPCTQSSTFRAHFGLFLEPTAG